MQAVHTGIALVAALALAIGGLLADPRTGEPAPAGSDAACATVEPAPVRSGFARGATDPRDDARAGRADPLAPPESAARAIGAPAQRSAIGPGIDLPVAGAGPCTIGTVDAEEFVPTVFVTIAARRAGGQDPTSIR